MIEESLRQLVIELRARHLLPTEKNEARELLLESLLSTLNTGGSVIQNGQPAEESEASVATVRMLKERFVYVDLEQVSSGMTDRLRDIRQGKDPASVDEGGIILDLRDCGGNAVSEVASSLEILADWERPLVALVDGGTRAAAEIFAGQLREELGCVLVGKPTRGLPYPLHSVDLGDGVTVMLPDIPAEADPKPLAPDVLLSAGDHESETAVQDTVQAVNRDVYVRKAVDLLTAICAFRQKHF